MQIRFIGQGYNRQDSGSVAQALIESFGDNNFHTFQCLVAFASHTGVGGLKPHVITSKDHILNFRVIVGVDQKGTSKEALECLFEWGVDSYIYYTSQRIIFHPKIYIFEGDEKVRVIVGSNNLTQTGLAQNIEGALEYTFNKSEIEEGSNVLDQIKSYYAPLLSGVSPNLKRLDQELINILVEAGVVPTESARRAQYKKERVEVSMNIGQLFPSIPVQALPADFTPVSRSTRTNSADVGESDTIDELDLVETRLGELVWKKDNLPGSDVQQSPSGNPTGGLRLVQAGYEIENTSIDQTTYFRHVVFGNEIWVVTNQSPFRELAEVDFQLMIDGQFKGVYRLNVRHKPSGEAGQGNYTTSVSWGAASKHISEKDLKGKTLSLYRQDENGSPFTISIS